MISDEIHLTIKGEKYKYIFVDLLGLLKFLNRAPELTESFENMLTVHRRQNANTTDFVIEALENTASKFRFSLIYVGTQVVSIARIKVNPTVSVISSVHTSEKYRGKGLCTANMQQMMKRCKTKRFELGVKITNKTAIKCYEKVGFHKIKQINFQGEPYFILTR